MKNVEMHTRETNISAFVKYRYQGINISDSVFIFFALLILYIIGIMLGYVNVWKVVVLAFGKTSLTYSLVLYAKRKTKKYEQYFIGVLLLYISLALSFISHYFINPDVFYIYIVMLLGLIFTSTAFYLYALKGIRKNTYSLGAERSKKGLIGAFLGVILMNAVAVLSSDKGNSNLYFGTGFYLFSACATYGIVFIMKGFYLNVLEYGKCNKRTSDSILL